MNAEQLSDIELLRVEIDTLWARDDRGRLVKDRGLNGFRAPHLVIASALDGGQVVALGEEVRDSVATELEGLVEGTHASGEPAAAPPALRGCEELLARIFGPVEVSCGPSYVAASAPDFPSVAEIRTAADRSSHMLPSPPEVAGWTSEEWRLLTTGALGPWAVAVIDGQIVATCFCACLTEHAAEAGAWTHPDFRGQGHAAAVTSAWAGQVLTTGRYVFYSTSSGNLSSQRVAARLGLRPIGWMWRIGRPTARVMQRAGSFGVPAAMEGRDS